MIAAWYGFLVGFAVVILVAVGGALLYRRSIRRLYADFARQWLADAEAMGVSSVVEMVHAGYCFGKADADAKFADARELSYRIERARRDYVDRLIRSDLDRFKQQLDTALLRATRGGPN